MDYLNEDNINFSSNHSDGDDILGDAYEYLMRNFSKESGKSKGQFYTPAEVSRIMAKIIGIDKASTNDTTVYDPRGNSDSTLLSRLLVIKEFTHFCDYCTFSTDIANFRNKKFNREITVRVAIKIGTE